MLMLYIAAAAFTIATIVSGAIRMLDIREKNQMRY